MTRLNAGKTYHVMGFDKGVPPLWPQAKEGDEISIRNTLGTSIYRFKGSKWTEVSFNPAQDPRDSV
jgi:hypothetical protein